jgi:hypothetical protein
MPRGVRILGAILLLLGLLVLTESIAVQFSDGLAGSIAANSICNSEPCTTDQYKRMSLIVGPVSFLVLAGLGLVLLKARAEKLPAQGERAASDPELVAEIDVGERLRSIDRLREQGGITALEHAEQRRRILDSV